jgi:HEAT repeat protein
MKRFNGWFLIFILVALTNCNSGPAPSLESEDPDLRRAKISQLMNAPDAVKYTETFIQFLEGDPDNLVRAQAAVALGKIKNPLSIPSLIKALKDPNPWVRSDAAKSLGELGAAQAIPDLANVLDRDTLAGVRRVVVNALHKINQLDVIPHLIQALDDSDPGVAELAYQALSDITKQKLPKDKTAWEKWHNEPR